ncbi:MAG: hypothetical protein K940chlam2_01111 [Chlamydiae bacterium]|nr:hypothetical protein [Chlamydiota bacterium]
MEWLHNCPWWEPVRYFTVNFLWNLQLALGEILLV